MLQPSLKDQFLYATSFLIEYFLEDLSISKYIVGIIIYLTFLYFIPWNICIWGHENRNHAIGGRCVYDSVRDYEREFGIGIGIFFA